MKVYQHIIFDLDGTLTDSKPGIINSAVYACQKLGIKDPPVEEFDRLIGVPLQDYFRMIFDFSDAEVEKAVIYFREYYGSKGVYENEVYDGIPGLLNKLKKAGKKIYISTAKYEKYAWVVTDHFQFTPLITDMVGADQGGVHATKTELAAKIIQRNKITDLEKTIVIGDKHMDIQAGHQNGIDSIGVTYGFGTSEELVGEKPTYLVDSVAELEGILVISC